MILGAISLDLFATLLGGAVALMPIFARDILQTGPLGLGLLRSAPALGGVLAETIAPTWILVAAAGATGTALLIAMAIPHSDKLDTTDTHYVG